MAWRQGCMGSMNMQCELNLYSTFLKKVLFQQLRFIPVLPATDKNQGKRPAAARMGINPTTTGRVVQGP